MEFFNIPNGDFPQPLASSFTQLLPRSVILQPDLGPLSLKSGRESNSRHKYPLLWGYIAPFLWTPLLSEDKLDMTVGSKRSVSVIPDPCDSSDHSIFNADVMRYHDNLLSSSEPVQGVGEETLAPLMTSCAFTKGSQFSQEKQKVHQFGLLAGLTEGSPPVVADDPRVFFNITPPSSTFICGSQGSGKSHTLSCILESCLIPSKAGQLPNPLTGIVFHYDTFISDTMGSPCEAAFLSSHPDIEVRVLCAPTNLHAIKVCIIFHRTGFNYHRNSNVLLKEPIRDWISRYLL